MNCSKFGHFAKVRRQQKTIKDIENKSMDGAKSGETYQLNICKIKLSQNIFKFNIPKKYNFKRYLFINNRLVKVLIETGANVLVSGIMQAKL